MDLYTAIKNRRSHRFYKPDPVPREVLERVFEAALWAPSGTNLQPWDITVLTGKPRDDFVALASQAGEDIAPKLRKLFDEERVALVTQFFKNLGGAPTVVAITVWRDADPFTQEIHCPKRLRPDAESAPGRRGRGTGDLLDVGRFDPGKRTAEIFGTGRPASAGHHPHRLLRQNPAGGAPQRSAGALAGVLIAFPVSG